MFETGSSRRWRVSRTALVLAQALFLSVSLLGPAFVSAADPSADASGTPPPSAEPSTEPTPAPTAEPTTEPTPDPTAAPTSDPTPAPTPDPTAAPTTDPTPGPEAASVPYIVTFASGVDGAAQTAILAGAGAVETGSIPVLRMRSILLAPSSAANVVAALRADPQVFRVDADRVREAEADPNDSSYGEQWSLPKIGWDQVYGGVTPSGSAVVALLDTGVDASHPDLAGQLMAGTSVLDGSAGTTDPNGHGTAMAGIIAAWTDNGTGVAGIGYAGVKVMPVTVLDSAGLGRDSDIIAGVVWAVDHGADVINMSFSNPGYSASLQAAIDYAWAHNIVVVAATGNDGSSTVTFPAGDRGVIGVSNTDQNDALHASSNYGADTFLGAPGTDIVTTAAGGGTSSVTGTSASAAEVSAAAALLMAADPSASNGVIVGRLARTADAAGSADQTGNGRLNLGRAIADASTESITPAGAAPVGSGGPLVGPYAIATFDMSVTATPSSTVAGSSGNGLAFVFTSSGNSGSGSVSVTVPTPASGTPWTAPGSATLSISSVTCTTATLGAVVGNVININFTGCSNNNHFTLNYGSVTAPTLAGTYTFSVSSLHGSNPTVTVGAGPVTAAQSTVSASPSSVPADDVTTSTVTVTLKDVNSNPVAGKSVSLAKTSGPGTPTISAASGASNASGVVTFTVKSTTAGADVFAATDTTDSVTITQTATVTFVGPVTAAQSTVSASPSSVPADDVTTSTVTVTLKDVNSNPVAGKSVSLAKTSGPGTPTISAASGASNASGVVTFTVKSTTAGADVFAATDTTDSVTITQTATVTFTAGPVTAAQSTVSASPSSVPADDVTTSTVTVTLKDVNSNPVAGKSVSLAKTSGPGTPTISAASGASNASGVVTFTVKSTTAGADVFAATDTTDSVTITQTATVTFVGPVTAAQSTVSASPSSVPADDVTTSTVTVTLKDVNSNPVAGKSVSLAKTSGPGTPTISAASGASNASGVVTFTVKSTTAGADVFAATDTTDSVTITQTATVTFTAGVLHHFSVTNTVGGPIADQMVNVPFNIEVTAQDQFNNTVTTFDGNGFKANITSNRTCPVSCPGPTTAFTNGVLASYSVTLTSTGAGSTITAAGLGGNSGITGASNLFAVNSANAAPDPGTISGSSSVAEGSSSGYSSSASDADVGDTLSYAWSISSGNASVGSGQGTSSVSVNFGDGPSTVVLHLVIDDGHAHAVSPPDLTVTVDNVDPTADLANDGPVDEGSPATISVSNQFDPSSTDTTAGFHYAYSCSNGDLSGATYAGSGTNASTTCTYPDGPSTHTVKARIIDKDGGYSEYTTVVTVDNVDPTADLANDGPVDEGSPATISVSNQFDPSSTDTTAGFHYAYSCSNGDLSGATYAGSGTNASTTCTYPDGPSTHTVKARIIDKDGGYSEYTTVVTVDNVDPTADLANDGPVDEGSPATISVSNQFDPSSTDTTAGFHYAYSCSNGDLSGATYAGSGTNASTTCTYPDGPSTHTVKARIIDKDGGYSEYTTVVTVDNVDPTADLANDGPVDEGSPATISVSNQFDPSSTDTTAGFHYAYSCSNGDLSGATYAGSGTNASTTCTYPDGPSTHTVKARIIDKDGGYSEYTTVVTVDNVDPTADLANDGPVDEGSPATISVSNQFDPSSTDTTAGFHYAYSCSNGDLSGATYAGSGTNASTTCTYPDGPSTHTVKARIIDKDGGYSEYTTVVTVDNVAPSIPALVLPLDLAITNDATPTFDWTDSTDPAGANDTITYLIQADNNGCTFASPEINVPSLSPSTYTPPSNLADGTYCWRVRASDEDGGASSYSSHRNLTIDASAPNVAITFPVNGGAYSEASWDPGCTAAAGDFCGTASDPGSGLQSVVVSFRRGSGLYWNWATPGFTSATELFQSVGTAATWNQFFAFANFPSSGPYTIHARATDNATNTSNVSSTFTINRYSLVYNSPIDGSNLTNVIVNTGKNGRVIPVKINVYLDGVNQSSAQIAEGLLSISVNPVTCGSSLVTDDVELYADAGASNGNTNLFRSNGDGWIYNLDTTGLHLTTGQCYRLDVYLKANPSATPVRISTQQFAIFRPVK